MCHEWSWAMHCVIESGGFCVELASRKDIKIYGLIAFSTQEIMWQGRHLCWKHWRNKLIIDLKKAAEETSLRKAAQGKKRQLIREPARV